MNSFKIQNTNTKNTNNIIFRKKNINKGNEQKISNTFDEIEENVQNLFVKSYNANDYPKTYKKRYLEESKSDFNLIKNIAKNSKFYKCITYKSPKIGNNSNRKNNNEKSNRRNASFQKEFNDENNYINQKILTENKIINFKKQFNFIPNPKCKKINNIYKKNSKIAENERKQENDAISQLNEKMDIIK